MKPVLNLRRFTKFVPTDMDWHSTFAGGVVRVSILLREDSDGAHYNVVVSGTDDTHVNRWFEEPEAAFALFNRITHIQSSADLEPFDPELHRAEGADCNGWPRERPLREDTEGIWPVPDENEYDIECSEITPEWWQNSRSA